jgi:hypothetical protein
MRRNSLSRADNATFLGLVVLVVLLTAPMWAVAAAGLAAPLLIAGVIAVAIVAGIASIFS